MLKPRRYYIGGLEYDEQTDHCSFRMQIDREDLRDIANKKIDDVAIIVSIKDQGTQMECTFNRQFAWDAESSVVALIEFENLLCETFSWENAHMAYAYADEALLYQLQLKDKKSRLGKASLFLQYHFSRLFSLIKFW